MRVGFGRSLSCFLMYYIIVFVEYLYCIVICKLGSIVNLGAVDLLNSFVHRLRTRHRAFPGEAAYGGSMHSPMFRKAPLTIEHPFWPRLAQRRLRHGDTLLWGRRIQFKFGMLDLTTLRLD
jgi:hypothetical protein